jgi:hypothetical protein
MNRQLALSVSLLLLLAAFLLVSLGTTNDNPVLWQLGLGCLLLGGLIPPVGRFLGTGRPDPPPDSVGAAEDVRC